MIHYLPLSALYLLTRKNALVRWDREKYKGKKKQSGNLYWLTRTNLHSVSFPSKWHPTINEQEDIQHLMYYEETSCTWVFERWARISDKPARQWACIWWASSSPHCRWPRGRTASRSCPVAPSGRCTYPGRCPSGWSSAGHCVTAPPGFWWQGGSGRVSPGSVSPSGWSQIPVEEDKKKEWKNVCHAWGGGCQATYIQDLFPFS